MTSPERCTARVQLLMTEEDARELRRLAREMGVSMAGWVRVAVRNAARGGVGEGVGCGATGVVDYDGLGPVPLTCNLPSGHAGYHESLDPASDSGATVLWTTPPGAISPGRSSPR